VTPIAAFRVVAIVEAVSYLALLVAVVTYRVFDGPDLIGVLGPIHGIAFLVYLALALKVRESQGWNLWQTLLVIIASAIPVGGFIVADRLVEEERPATRT
jgi:integral membrane protein